MELLGVWRFTMNLPSFSRIHYRFILFFAIYYQIANLLWIHFAPAKLFWIKFLFREFTIFVAYIQLIHHLFRKVTMNSFSPEFTFLGRNYKFAFCLTNSLSISRDDYQYAINFSNSIWIQFQFHAFAIYFVRIPWIHYLFLSYTINSLSISLIK